MYKGKIIRVIDGDTLEAVINMWPEITILAKVRVYGVNTPELKTKTKAALDAKKFTHEIAQDQEAVFMVYGKDSFGRVLCSVQLGTKDLATELLNNGHAEKYRKT